MLDVARADACRRCQNPQLEGHTLPEPSTRGTHAARALSSRDTRCQSPQLEGRTLLKRHTMKLQFCYFFDPGCASNNCDYGCQVHSCQGRAGPWTCQGRITLCAVSWLALACRPCAACPSSPWPSSPRPCASGPPGPSLHPWPLPRLHRPWPRGGCAS